MTRKHYEAIAKIIDTMLHARKNNPIHVAYQLADYFEQENQRFNRERFLIACGIEK